MSHRLSLIDRLLVGLLGLLGLGAGGWALLWALDHPMGDRLSGYLSLDAVEGVLASPWYPAVLLLVVIAGLVCGLWLLVANLRPHTFNRLTAGESGEAGQLTLSVSQLARATGTQIRRHADITGVDTATRMDRGRHVVTTTVHASPEVRLRSLLDAIEEADRDFHAAVPGLDLDTRYLLQLNPVAPG